MSNRGVGWMEVSGSMILILFYNCHFKKNVQLAWLKEIPCAWNGNFCGLGQINQVQKLQWNLQPTFTLPPPKNQPNKKTRKHLFM